MHVGTPVCALRDREAAPVPAVHDARTGQLRGQRRPVRYPRAPGCCGRWLTRPSPVACSDTRWCAGRWNRRPVPAVRDARTARRARVLRPVASESRAAPVHLAKCLHVSAQSEAVSYTCDMFWSAYYNKCIYDKLKYAKLYACRRPK